MDQYDTIKFGIPSKENNGMMSNILFEIQAKKKKGKSKQTQQVYPIQVLFHTVEAEVKNAPSEKNDDDQTKWKSIGNQIICSAYILWYLN